MNRQRMPKSTPLFMRALDRVRAVRKGRDKGSMLLETVVSLGLLSMLTLGYTVSSVNANITQRTAVNSGIASQITQDALEMARSTPWTKIGTKSKPVAGMLPVDAAHVTGTLETTRALVSRGLSVTVNTAVQWQEKTSSTGYGTKIMTVNVSWTDRPGDPSTKRDRKETATLTPGIGEAAPSSVRVGVEGTVPTPPAMPALSQKVVAGPVMRLSWPAVKTTDQYLIEYRLNSGAWKNTSTTSLTIDIRGTAGAFMEARIRASSPAGISLYSNVVTKTLPGG